MSDNDFIFEEGDTVKCKFKHENKEYKGVVFESASVLTRFMPVCNQIYNKNKWFINFEYYTWQTENLYHTPVVLIEKKNQFY